MEGATCLHACGVVAPEKANQSFSQKYLTTVIASPEGAKQSHTKRPIK
jgi:hypothetical protein